MRERDLRWLASGAEERARRAAEAFTDVAAEHGLLDVAIGSTGSPLGELLVAVTPRGLLRIAYPGEGPPERVLEELARAVSPRILESASATGEVRRELDEYFAGRRQVFEVPVDFSLTRGFTQRTLRAATRVPFGELVSYGELARRVGNPRAARAIGNALGSNPIPIVVPCHRIVRADGSPGGYGGAQGSAEKSRLLDFEAGR